MRVNKVRAVSVKSVAAQRDRTLLTVGEQLRRQSLDARNIIWSILPVEGLKPPKRSRWTTRRWRHGGRCIRPPTC